MELIYDKTRTVNVGAGERWASVIAGGALALLGLKRRTPMGYAMALLGGDLVYRGATGHCRFYQALGVRTADKGQGAETTSIPYGTGVRVDKAVTVNKPREEVYRFWRNLENLPKFMGHLESVKTLDDKRSHWVAKAPAGKRVEWDAEINNEIENRLIGWRSLEGSDVDNAGSVQFKDAPSGRGTEVKIELQYNPPGGSVGAVFAKLFGEEPGQQIEDDLRRFKRIMEAGELPTTEGQASAREPGGTNGSSGASHKRSDPVQKASEQSFPASDSPSY